MGLDQYAYAVTKNGEKEELATWRKHPNLQGWMENLWHNRGCPGCPDEPNSMGMSDFNCIPLELYPENLDDLEEAINASGLPDTVGFFFGSNSDDYYKEYDLEFIRKAREALDNGLTVMYDSWW
jgi:hypothetical protein